MTRSVVSRISQNLFRDQNWNWYDCRGQKIDWPSWSYVVYDCNEIMHTSCSGHKQSENCKKPQVVRLVFKYVNIYENMIFFHNRKVNRQNYPKSILLNASIKVEASFLQFGYNYSILLIKSGIFHSIGSNRIVVLTGAKGSNRITLNLEITNIF